jgi:ABC-type multidrug transport system permease subunit
MSHCTLCVSFSNLHCPQSLILFSCSVLVPSTSLPRFWIFMYRATPVTYLVSSMISTGVGGVPIVCAANELVKFDPPTGQTCSQYLTDYLSYAGGSLLNPTATQQCQFCPVSDTNTLLAGVGIFFEHRWRDFGITLAYSAINIALALGLYWLFRVPKKPIMKNGK